MPIYAYRCDACGHAVDLLRKVSDPPLSVCPACGADAFRKQVTAAGFQLKGSGWYVTDFRGGPQPSKPDAKAEAKPEAKPAAATGKGADAAPAASAKADAPAPGKSASAAAPAPAPTSGGSSGSAK
jgi:putative FmdB family regulatory protein